MFYENKKQETTEIGTCNLPSFCDLGLTFLHPLQGWSSLSSGCHAYKRGRLRSRMTSSPPAASEHSSHLTFITGREGAIDFLSPVAEDGSRDGGRLGPAPGRRGECRAEVFQPPDRKGKAPLGGAERSDGRPAGKAGPPSLIRRWLELAFCWQWSSSRERTPTWATAGDHCTTPVPGPKHVLREQEARDDGNRVPPKLVKVAQGTQKALMATRYGQGVAPLPKRMELETRLAHRVTSHGPGPRTRRRRRRPDRPPGHKSPYKRRRPTRNSSHVYRPEKHRYRKPHEAGTRSRPYYYKEDEPEYHDLEEEYDDDYFDDRRRPVRSHQHSYHKRKKSSKPKYHRPAHLEDPDEEEGAYSSNEPSYLNRPRPYLNLNTKKLYSSSIKSRHREREESAREEEPEESEDDYGRPYPKRPYRRQSGHRGSEEDDPPGGGYVPQDWGQQGYTGPQDLDIGFGQGLVADPWPQRLPYAALPQPTDRQIS
ncbi:hypothetical protein AAG570_004369 [Ranatra chinensis]|uniref:Uncharacterized protein n=1 Tax=Ranatra chinensis TaxID=642074 RepID=A0ABD0Y0Q9_9HEMI